MDWAPSLDLEMNSDKKKIHNLDKLQYTQSHVVQVGCYQHDDAAWNRINDKINPIGFAPDTSRVTHLKEKDIQLLVTCQRFV